MSTIDELMDRDPLLLTPEDIDSIIAYHRENRARGASPKKAEGPKAKLDLAAIGLKKPTVAAPTIIRRI